MGGRVAVCGSNGSILNHATVQMDHTLAHQAAFHQHSIGAPLGEPSIETIARISFASGAMGSTGLGGVRTATRSAGFFALRLHSSTVPCSVPTMSLVGPAAGSYSMHTAPSTTLEFFSCRVSVSTGSPMRRMSHQ